MEENMINNERIAENNSGEGTRPDYISEFINKQKELESNFVPKDEYDRVCNDNHKLTEALFNGERFTEQKPEEKIDCQAIRNELYSGDYAGSSYDYIKKLMDLRSQVLKDSGEDIFISSSSRSNPSIEEIATAQKVASAYEWCLEYSDGDPQIFTQELMRITNDTPLSRRKI